ncbi:uncharacterized protein LOC110864661 [Helianthus annuus]|uniref:uncharacterized protein LOC110864661 n=1 Tax=Helianthus annuus TaxID=4232 RepID=UPI000B8EEC72|nr:uncharacterized protein LOC110864661 [Helianthus annuus]
MADQTPKINFKSLKSDVSLEGVDVVLPIDSVRQVNSRLANTLYGYFQGDRIAYPVVEYFLKTNWKKHGFQKIVMNSNGFFFFKFEDSQGMNNVLEGGPWLIRNKPLFLNTWSPTNTLKKEDIKKVAVWVKLHEVPLVAYTDDGLSMLASKIGSPLRLDSYTIDMCNEAWGRSSYARALIDISAEHDFKEVLTIAIPELDENKYVNETIRVEYEWKPPRCAHCCVFGHDSEECAKCIRSTVKPPTNSLKVDEDGYTVVKTKKNVKKSGFQVNNQKPKFEYRPVDKKKKAEWWGTGENLLFWHDNWCGSGPLKDWYKELFKIASNIDAMVSDHLILDENYKWVWSWDREPIRGNEGEQLGSLKNILESFSMKGGAEFWAWNNDKEMLTVAIIRAKRLDALIQPTILISHFGIIGFLLK